MHWVYLTLCAVGVTNERGGGLPGYVTSDTDACGDIIQGHKCGIDHFPARPTNGTDATRQCLQGGTDVNSGDTYATYLAKAVNNSELDMTWARLALRNSYKMRMKAGLFDPSPSPFKDISSDVVGAAEHQEMSLNSALKGMVLLKRGALPFRAFASPPAPPSPLLLLPAAGLLLLTVSLR